MEVSSSNNDITISATLREFIKGELNKAIPFCSQYSISTLLVPIQKHPIVVNFVAYFNTLLFKYCFNKVCLATSLR